jgi:hypothetical protein
MLINKFSTFMEINCVYFNLMKIRGKPLITLFFAEIAIGKRAYPRVVRNEKVC